MRDPDSEPDTLGYLPTVLLLFIAALLLAIAAWWHG